MCLGTLQLIQENIEKKEDASEPQCFDRGAVSSRLMNSEVAKTVVAAMRNWRAPQQSGFTSDGEYNGHPGTLGKVQQNTH